MTLRRVLPLTLLAAAVALCLATTSTARAEDAKGSVSGKVVSATGEAVKPADDATAKAYVMKPDDAPVPTRPAAGGGGARPTPPDYEGKAVAKADIKNSAFKIADVPAGKYVLVVVITGQGGGRGRADIEVAAGKDTAVPDVKLAARGGRRGGAGN
jgi:hypothetical protein